MNFSWDTIRSFVTDLGVVKGTFVVFFWMAHGALFALYRGRLKDRQKEIDRLAAENKEYRERFTGMLDKQFKLPRTTAVTPTRTKKRASK